MVVSRTLRDQDVPKLFSASYLFDRVVIDAPIDICMTAHVAHKVLPLRRRHTGIGGIMENLDEGRKKFSGSWDPT